MPGVGAHLPDTLIFYTRPQALGAVGEGKIFGRGHQPWLPFPSPVQKSHITRCMKLKAFLSFLEGLAEQRHPAPLPAAQGDDG